MEVTDGILFELFLWGRSRSIEFRQTADAVALKAAMQV
jgi:hypothetical protein